MLLENKGQAMQDRIWPSLLGFGASISAPSTIDSRVMGPRSLSSPPSSMRKEGSKEGKKEGRKEGRKGRKEGKKGMDGRKENENKIDQAKREITEINTDYQDKVDRINREYEPAALLLEAAKILRSGDRLPSPLADWLADAFEAAMPKPVEVPSPLCPLLKLNPVT